MPPRGGSGRDPLEGDDDRRQDGGREEPGVAQVVDRPEVEPGAEPLADGRARLRHEESVGRQEPEHPARPQGTRHRGDERVRQVDPPGQAEAKGQGTGPLGAEHLGPHVGGVGDDGVVALGPLRRQEVPRHEHDLADPGTRQRAARTIEGLGVGLMADEHQASAQRGGGRPRDRPQQPAVAASRVEHPDRPPPGGEVPQRLLRQEHGQQFGGVMDPVDLRPGGVFQAGRAPSGRFPRRSPDPSPALRAPSPGGRGLPADSGRPCCRLTRRRARRRRRGRRCGRWPRPGRRRR